MPGSDQAGRSLNIWILVPFRDGSDTVDRRYRDDITSICALGRRGRQACRPVPAGRSGRWAPLAQLGDSWDAAQDRDAQPAPDPRRDRPAGAVDRHEQGGPAVPTLPSTSIRRDMAERLQPRLHRAGVEAEIVLERAQSALQAGFEADLRRRAAAAGHGQAVAAREARRGPGVADALVLVAAGRGAVARDRWRVRAGLAVRRWQAAAAIDRRESARATVREPLRHRRSADDQRRCRRSARRTRRRSRWTSPRRPSQPARRGPTPSRVVRPRTPGPPSLSRSDDVAHRPERHGAVSSPGPVRRCQ